jgi:hypothetical protein
MAPERPEGGAEKHHGGKERALEDASYLVWEGEPLTSPKIPQILTPAVSDGSVAMAAKRFAWCCIVLSQRTRLRVEIQKYDLL